MPAALEGLRMVDLSRTLGRIHIRHAVTEFQQKAVPKDAASLGAPQWLARL